MANFTLAYTYQAVDKFSAPLRNINRQLKTVDAALKQTKINSRRMSDQFNKSAKSMSKAGKTLLTRVTLPVAALSAGLLKVAKEDQLVARRFSVVFDSIKNDAKSAVKVLREEFGRSETEAQNLLANTGGLLTGLGFNATKALKLAETIEQRAINIATFQGLEGGSKRASQAIISAILGQTIGLKGLNIAITGAQVSESLRAKGLDKLTGSIGEQARVLTVLSLIEKQAVRTDNAFSKAQKDLNVQTAKLSAEFSDLGSQFAETMIPFFNSMTVRIRKMIAGLQSLSPETRRLILIIAGFAATVGPILISLSLLLKLFAFLTPAVVLLKGGVLALGAAFTATPLGLFVGSIALVIAGVVLLTKNWDSLLKRVPILGKLAKAVMTVLEPFVKLIGFLAKKLEQLTNFVGRSIFGGSKADVINNRTGNVAPLASPFFEGTTVPNITAIAANSAQQQGNVKIEIVDKGGNVGRVDSSQKGFESFDVGFNFAGVR